MGEGCFHECLKFLILQIFAVAGAFIPHTYIYLQYVFHFFPNIVLREKGLFHMTTSCLEGEPPASSHFLRAETIDDVADTYEESAAQRARGHSQRWIKTSLGSLLGMRFLPPQLLDVVGV